MQDEIKTAAALLQGMGLMAKSGVAREGYRWGSYHVIPVGGEGLSNARAVKQGSLMVSRLGLGELGSERCDRLAGVLDRQGIRCVARGYNQGERALEFSVAAGTQAVRFAGLPRCEGHFSPVQEGALVGVTVSDPLSVIRDSGMCQSGAAEFLDRFGISYCWEILECDCCGSPLDDYSDDRELSSVDTFVLTADMVAAIAKAGYTDEVRQALEIADLDLIDVPWETLPVPKMMRIAQGWTYKADYGSLLGELDSEDLLLVLPKVVEYVRRCVDAGFAPAIPGTLSLDDRMVWSFDPDTCWFERVDREIFWRVNRTNGQIVLRSTDGDEIAIDAEGLIRVSTMLLTGGVSDEIAALAPMHRLDINI